MRARRKRAKYVEPEDDGFIYIDGWLYTPEQVQECAKCTMDYFDELPLEERRLAYGIDD